MSLLVLTVSYISGECAFNRDMGADIDVWIPPPH
jgi:hypothetical protein